MLCSFSNIEVLPKTKRMANTAYRFVLVMPLVRTRPPSTLPGLLALYTWTFRLADRLIAGMIPQYGGQHSTVGSLEVAVVPGYSK